MKSDINIIYANEIKESDIKIKPNDYNVLYDYGDNYYINISILDEVELIICSNVNKILEYRRTTTTPVLFSYPIFKEIITDIDANKKVVDNKVFNNKENLLDDLRVKFLYTEFSEELYNNFNFLNFSTDISDKQSVELDHCKFSEQYLLERINIYKETGIFEGYDSEIEEWNNNCSTILFKRNFDTLILLSTYLKKGAYAAYGFVHRRNIAYVESGKKCLVIMIGKKVENSFYMIDNVVVTGEKNISLENAIKMYNIKNIVTHSFTARNYNEILINFLKNNDDTRLISFLHGSDIMSAKRRLFDVTIDKYFWYHNVTKSRQNQWIDFLQEAKKNEISSEQLHVVFVSEYLRDVTYKDISRELFEPYSKVIHNYIDSEIFKYIPKDAEQRFKLLAIRSFKTRTYANDVLVKVILELSKYPRFNEMQFLIIGSGELHQKCKAKLEHLTNVKFDNKFKPQSEIAKIHKEYGILLSPARMDTQGVNRDEAMSSGLVAIANDVGGTREFINNDVGYLLKKGDYKAMAKAVIELIENPELFKQKSQRASKHTRKVSGYDKTIGKELEIIYGKQENDNSI